MIGITMLIGIGTCTALVAHLYGYRGMIDEEVRTYNLTAIGRVISRDREIREMLPADDISDILQRRASDRDIERIGRRVTTLMGSLDPSTVIAKVSELESDCPGILDALTPEEKNIYGRVLTGQEISKKEKCVLMETLGI